MPVASSLQQLRDGVVAAVDKRFAEPVKLSFLEKGATDADRPACEASGVLRVGGGDETNLAGGFAQEWRSKLAAGKAELHVDVATYSGPRIKTGDRVRAVSRRGMPWFEVLRVDDRGETRLVLALGEL